MIDSIEHSILELLKEEFGCRSASSAGLTAAADIRTDFVCRSASDESSSLTSTGAGFRGFEVDSFPSNFEDFSFTSPKGCILIRFENVAFDSQHTVYACTSSGNYNFTIFIGFRYLNKHSESYSYLNHLKTVLNGFEIMNKRILLNKLEFVEDITGDLWYAMSISINLPLSDENKDTSDRAEILGGLFRGVKEIDLEE